MTTEILAGTKMNSRRLPGGFFATIEKLKEKQYQVRVYDALGELVYIESVCKTYEIASAVAHREAWAEYVKLLLTNYKSITTGE